MALFSETIGKIEDFEGGINAFTLGHLRLGFNTTANGRIVYREWAPNATQAFLIGDFSNYISPFSYHKILGIEILIR